jgi:Replication protein A C terminal
MQYFGRLGGPDHLPPDGINVTAIAQNCSGVSIDRVRAEVETLVSDGHLYTTIDDDQYVPGRMFGSAQSS